MELSSSLSTALGLQLPSTLAFDYPSVAAMAQHIHSLMAPTQQSGGLDGAEAGFGTAALVPAAVPLGAETQPAGRLLVSLRLTARLPAGNLGSGDAIGLVPYSRWDLEALRVSTAGSRQGSRLGDGLAGQSVAVHVHLNIMLSSAPLALLCRRPANRSCVCGTALSWAEWTALMRPCSALPGRRRTSWTLSNACCWRCALGCVFAGCAMHSAFCSPR